MDVCLYSGRIIAVHRDAYRVTTEIGERTGVLAGRFRHEATRHSDLPAVGDYVCVRLPDGDGPAVVEAVVPRKTVFMRRAAGDRPDDQVIAANIDFVFVMMALDGDVNVRRVQERTGHAFTPAAAQALMDLGATVCLARIPRCELCPLAEACPSRGSRYEPLRKQGPFEGSFRQRRAATLRLLADAEQPVAALDPDAVASLARDGLVLVSDGTVSLPG